MRQFRSTLQSKLMLGYALVVIKTVTTLFYLDLDEFKVINETCGHLAGDQLLIQVSEALTKLLTPGTSSQELAGTSLHSLAELARANRPQVRPTIFLMLLPACSSTGKQDHFLSAAQLELSCLKTLSLAPAPPCAM
jgi:predicted signal transduction protein with EAL and GGDEF domain